MAKTPANNGKKWTNSDLNKLQDMANKNTPTRLIAWNLQRSESAVRNKASDEGVSLKPTNQSPYNRKK